jgi:hypothetical protein
MVWASPQEMPQVSFGGGVYVVAWVDEYLTPYVPHIVATRVTPQGKVLDSQGFQVSFGDSSEEWPGLSFDGANFLAVWCGLKAASAGYGVWAARISPQGAVLDSPAVCLALDGVYKDDATVAFNGTNSLYQRMGAGQSAQLTPIRWKFTLLFGYV